jgi:DNA repair protein RadC
MQHFRHLHDPPDDDLHLLREALGADGRAGLARRLLLRFGSLHAMAKAHPRALAQVDGCSVETAMRLCAGMAVGQRAAQPPAQLPQHPLSCAADAAAILAPGLCSLDEEELHCLYLDQMGRPIALAALTHGSTRHTIIDPVQVLRPAIHCGAQSIVLAHNHPSGVCEPSVEDTRATWTVKESSVAVGIELVDHLIITRSSWTSMTELGLLGPPALDLLG